MTTTTESSEMQRVRRMIDLVRLAFEVRNAQSVDIHHAVWYNYPIDDAVGLDLAYLMDVARNACYYAQRADDESDAAMARSYIKGAIGRARMIIRETWDRPETHAYYEQAVPGYPGAGERMRAMHIARIDALLAEIG